MEVIYCGGPVNDLDMPWSNALRAINVCRRLSGGVLGNLSARFCMILGKILSHCFVIDCYYIDSYESASPPYKSNLSNATNATWCSLLFSQTICLQLHFIFANSLLPVWLLFYS